MNISFIGCGNMGSAMLRGMLLKKTVSAEQICVAEKSPDARARAEKELGVETTQDNRAAAARADILFLAVKPQVLPQVIEEISTSVGAETTVVSMAPGKTLQWLRGAFGRSVRLIRIMPNTPALAGEGMTALCPDESVGEEELRTVENLLRSFSRTAVVPESLMNVVTGVSGSSPAYVFLFIEALADAAVLGGMPRGQAYEFAAQTVLGSAKMVLETGKHPGELKDMVCSPGGTTIEAVRVLEEKGFRGAVIDATAACIEKAGKL